MTDIGNHAEKWELWGYPQDEEWDGESFDIGYSTDSGGGAIVAQDMREEDAKFVLKAISFYLTCHKEFVTPGGRHD